MSSDSNSKIKTIAQNQLTEALTMSATPATTSSTIRQDKADSSCRLFDSGEDSDMTVQCGNRVWKLHRVILYAGSEYFKKACQVDKFQVRYFAASICTRSNQADSNQEGITGTIELKDEDPQMVGLFLRYFYAHDYQIDDNGKAPLIAHARMYAIADKYSVPLLKDLAKERFATCLKNIESKGIQSLDIPTFANAIEIIYTTTLESDRGLRDAIIPIMIEFKTQLRASDEFMGLILSNLREGEFAVEVIDAFANLGRVTACTWRCKDCNKTGSRPVTTCTACGRASLTISYGQR